MKYIKHFAALIYNFLDFILYVFGQRKKLDRPLFLYDKDIQFFYRKYGQHMKYLEFTPKNTLEEFIFLSDFEKYIKYYYNKDSETPLTIENPCLKYDDQLIFWKNSELHWIQNSSNKSQGSGKLGISFELNLK